MPVAGARMIACTARPCPADIQAFACAFRIALWHSSGCIRATLSIRDSTMNSRTCFLVLALAFAWPTLARAQLDAGISCVQAQLVAAGYDPGPVDGQVGARTRQALEEFQAKEGALTPHTLDLPLGNAVCRMIGLLRPDLQEYWPARQHGRIKIVSDPSVPESTVAALTASAIRAYRKIDELLEIRLAGRDVMVIASTPQQLLKLIKAHSSIPLADIRAGVESACNSQRGLGGLAIPGLIFVCAAPGAGGEDQSARQWRDFLIAHELLHLVQFQLMGAVPVERGDKAVLDRHGPIWLAEGVAQAFGNRVALDAPDWHYRIVNYKRLEFKFPSLTALEVESAVQSRRADVYRAGTVAAIDLVDLFGYPAIARFYDVLGRGSAWKVAFEKAFGIGVQDFYHHYENVTRLSPDGTPLDGPLDVLFQ